MKNNPFPYSDDNKRYHTWNHYLRHRFHCKVAKVPLDAGFTCPNRDGTKSVGGCLFCTPQGSGDCVSSSDDLMRQYEDGLKTMRRKWPQCAAIAYFQAYTNTYGPLSKIKACVEPFLEREEIKAIALATRADCLEDEKITYLQSLCDRCEVWVELGLQSVHDTTAAAMNRAHTYAEFEDCVRRLSHTDIKICVHLINSLPGETQEMMVDSARHIGKLPVHAVKIHMLHLMEHTRLARLHEQQPLRLQTMEEYVDTVIRQLEVLPAEMVIQRLTGDGLADELIAPQWTRKKVCVLNEIDKEMVRRNTWQSRLR
ncbi:MAG TPA: TIGR01212 family radical SAM protein [Candidatus Merdibacter merdavium]|uniref:TIGR01212 family radical SAM protein n=1 Tax=Candidatus Merdibacter merdavium TaxID=2838692 RepID=A0A9D2STW3_9FIRM|nr:TIGR01212 family radical SAM protein [Candidatus Merdibacter merdavium]